jgi:hypothetical protein
MGHAEWASGDWPGVDDFLEYECWLNHIIPQYKDAVICLYNLSKCGGNLIIDVMRTHPMILIGGIVQENPFFVPPDEFLRELRERRGPRTDAAVETNDGRKVEQTANEIKRSKPMSPIYQG